MKFEFNANIFFEADNIDDAFKKLEKHFKELSNGEDSEPFFEGGMHIDRKLGN